MSNCEILETKVTPEHERRKDHAAVLFLVRSSWKTVKLHKRIQKSLLISKKAKKQVREDFTKLFSSLVSELNEPNWRDVPRGDQKLCKTLRGPWEKMVKKRPKGGPLYCTIHHEKVFNSQKRLYHAWKREVDDWKKTELKSEYRRPELHARWLVKEAEV